MSTSLCPDDDTLHAFAFGNLSAPKWEPVSLHIEDCPGCLRRLNAMDGVKDDLIERLCKLPADQADQAEMRSGADPWENAVLAACHQSAGTGRRIIADARRDLTRRLANGPVWLDRFELQPNWASARLVTCFAPGIRSTSVSWRSRCSAPVARAGPFAARAGGQPDGRITSNAPKIPNRRPGGNMLLIRARGTINRSQACGFPQGCCLATGGVQHLL